MAEEYYLNRYLKFNSRALALFFVILAIEIVIALFFDDRFIRPFVGDVLVVALIFYLVKSIIDVADAKLAIGVLVFAWCVEFTQYFDLIGRLGLSNVKLAHIVIGSTFDPLDLLAYSIGALSVYVLTCSRVRWLYLLLRSNKCQD